jgi:hypothetical protein
LLDIHLDADHAPVEVQVGDRHIQLGHPGESSFIPSINTARLTRESALRDVYFTYEETRNSDVLYHFDTVDACESLLAEEWPGVALGPSTAFQAQEMLVK